MLCFTYAFWSFNRVVFFLIIKRKGIKEGKMEGKLLNLIRVISPRDLLASNIVSLT